MKVPSTHSQSAMKTDRKHRPGKAHGSKTPEVSGEKTTPSKVARGGAARVQVSRGARALHEARRPEEPDAQRIERLQKAIADGSFEVDADAVAERMLAEELE